MHPNTDAPTGRPRRAGVDLHPGSRDAPRAKRTSEQKQADDAKAAALKDAKGKAHARADKAKVNKLAALEDRLREDEKNYERTSIRPDLAHAPAPKQTTIRDKPRKSRVVDEAATYVAGPKHPADLSTKSVVYFLPFYQARLATFAYSPVDRVA